MAAKRLSPVTDETVSDIFRYLVNRSGRSIPQISAATKIPEDTLYSLHIRNSRKADMKMLKILADYFEEDVSIFCGTAAYQARPRLTPEQEYLIHEYDTLTDSAKSEVLGTIMRLKLNPENLARLI